MHIAINGTAAVTGGGVTYLLNLLPALAATDYRNSYYVFLSTRQTNIRWDLPPNFQAIQVHLHGHSILWRVLWEQVVLPVWLWQLKIDVLYSPADLAPLLAGCSVVLAVRNPLPYGAASAALSLWARLRRRGLRLLTWLSCHKAKRVIFVSHSSAVDIGTQLGVPEGKKAVIYHGLGERFLRASADDMETQRRYGLSEGCYILSVSALYPHKNFETLIEAFGLWVRRNNDQGYRLVIVGRMVDTAYYQRLQQMVADWGLIGRVMFTGEVRYADVPALYRSADLFVLASLLETFGHPLVEAMASRLPVITSHIPAAQEICGDAALYFKPGDAVELADRLEQVLNGPLSLREEMAKRGQVRAAMFSWERTAKETLALLQQAAEH